MKIKNKLLHAISECCQWYGVPIDYLSDPKNIINNYIEQDMSKIRAFSLICYLLNEGKIGDRLSIYQIAVFFNIDKACVIRSLQDARNAKTHPSNTFNLIVKKVVESR